MSPWPVILEMGQDISILSNILLKEEIPVNSSVSIKMTRETGGVNVSIPCTDFSSFPIGSCSYDGNVFLQTFLSNFFCPDDQVRMT